MPAAAAMRTTATMTVPITPVSETHAATAPTIAAAGRVNSHASAICPATPHCTDASRRPAPAPKIAPVATWVVDSAKPRWGGQDDRGRAGLGREALRGLDVADPLAQRLDDPPAAHVGAQRDRQTG